MRTEVDRDYSRKYYQKNKDKINSYAKKWSKNNKEVEEYSGGS